MNGRFEEKVAIGTGGANEELVGELEYGQEVAHGGERASVQRAIPGPRHKTLSVQPEALGRRAMEEATQDMKRLRQDPIESREEVVTRPGERAMREVVTGAETDDDRLITRYPNRAEVERERSEKARRRLDEETPEERKRRWLREGRGS